MVLGGRDLNHHLIPPSAMSRDLCASGVVLGAEIWSFLQIQGLSPKPSLSMVSLCIKESSVAVN